MDIKVHIEPGNSFGASVGEMLKISQIGGIYNDIDGNYEQIANDYIENQAEQDNITIQDEKKIVEAVAAIKDMLNQMQIPENQWLTIMRRIEEGS